MLILLAILQNSCLLTTFDRNVAFFLNVWMHCSFGKSKWWQHRWLTIRDSVKKITINFKARLQGVCHPEARKKQCTNLGEELEDGQALLPAQLKTDQAKNDDLSYLVWSVLKAGGWAGSPSIWHKDSDTRAGYFLTKVHGAAGTYQEYQMLGNKH